MELKAHKVLYLFTNLANTQEHVSHDAYCFSKGPSSWSHDMKRGAPLSFLLTTWSLMWQRTFGKHNLCVLKSWGANRKDIQAVCYLFLFLKKKKKL